MMANLLRRAGLWLGRKPKPVPVLLEVKIARLRATVRRGGQGSDLAAAELLGITTTIMALGR